jgi:AbiU2
MNEYIGYFHLQGHVLRYTLIVELGALFEKKSDSVCLHALLKRSKSNIPHELHASLVAEFDDSWPIAAKIGLLRNKAFAHRDVTIDFNDVFKSAEITLDNIRDLIEVSRSICDQLCVTFDVRKVAFVTDQTEDDCRRLFRDLGSSI